MRFFQWGASVSLTSLHRAAKEEAFTDNNEVQVHRLFRYWWCSHINRAWLGDDSVPAASCWVRLVLLYCKVVVQPSFKSGSSTCEMLSVVLLVKDPLQFSISALKEKKTIEYKLTIFFFKNIVFNKSWIFIYKSRRPFDFWNTIIVDIIYNLQVISPRKSDKKKF